ncbi:MAG: hypothetical protein MUP14_00325 [Dehalococcoidia bacterium]|nr:hypothetical protein [Dehalococcoidia bacterium]
MVGEELRHTAQHCQHQLASGCGEIEPLGHTHEPHPGLAQPLERLPLDTHVACPAVDHVDDHDVEQPELGVGKKCDQLRALVDALAACGQAVLGVDAHQLMSMAGAPALDVGALRVQ